MPEPLPKAVQFRKRHRDVWNAFNELGESCHQAGPLDEKTRRVVKLALSIGAGIEGATHSAVRNARKSGVSTEEMEIENAMLKKDAAPREFLEKSSGVTTVFTTVAKPVSDKIQ